MSSLRKLERSIIKSKCYAQNGNTGNFKEEWNTYRTTKYGENLPIDTTPKKKRFLDSKDKLINMLRYQKMMIQEHIARKMAEREAVESEVEVTE